MSLSTLLAIAALVASLVSLPFKSRAYPIVAVVVSGLETAMAFGLVRFSIAGVPLLLALGAVLALVGVLMLLKVSTKRLTAASSLLAFIGSIQVLAALQIVRGL